MPLIKEKGYTLEQFCIDNNAKQVTVLHKGLKEERITHIKGFKFAANYEPQDGQTIWYHKDGKLIEDIFKVKVKKVEETKDIEQPKDSTVIDKIANIVKKKKKVVKGEF